MALVQRIFELSKRRVDRAIGQARSSQRYGVESPDKNQPLAYRIEALDARAVGTRAGGSGPW